MAKSDLTFRTLISFLIGILVASTLSNLYLFFMLLLSGVCLFLWMTDTPRKPIILIVFACILGVLYYSAYVHVRGPIVKKRYATEGAYASSNPLVKVKQGFIENLNHSLPRREAALAAGLTVGDQTGFDSELKKEMSASATTHLVALSGYNIAIIIVFIQAIFAGRLPRRILFFFTTTTIILFVIMVGGAASVVRAAIMGGLMLLSKEAGRMKNIHGAIALSAFVMALHDPRIVMFDVGFQLSFMSLLGIVYLFPSIERVISQIREKKDRFGRVVNGEIDGNGKDAEKSITEQIIEVLKEHFLMSTAATLAVLPVILSYFETTSLTGIIANVLIASTVPLAMLFGFLSGVSSWILPQLGMTLGWIGYPLLHYDLGVIHIFSHLQILIGKPSSAWAIFCAYYALLAYFIYHWYPRQTFPRKRI
jgi:competence protein ComEC